MRCIILSLLFLFCISCNRSGFKSKWTKEQSPDVYFVRFETSKGNFDVKITREWSPLAADRFYQQVKHHFFDGGLFYRVVPNFVAQFGTTDTARMRPWQKFGYADEEVRHGNIKGSISFARSGKESRLTEVFINTKDNPRLDTINFRGAKGFPSFGDVVSGMDVVSSLYSGYGDKVFPKLDTMYRYRNLFMQQFPELDGIKKAYLIKQ